MKHDTGFRNKEKKVNIVTTKYTQSPDSKIICDDATSGGLEKEKLSKIAQENEYVKDKFESSQSSSSLNRDAPDGQDVSNNPVQDSTSVEDVPYEVVERNDQIQVPQPAAGQTPVYLKSLKKHQLARICPTLDANNTSNTPRWRYLLESFYGVDRRTCRQKALELELAYGGGGNPGFLFLETLESQKPELKVEDFVKVAKLPYIRRNDLADVLKDLEGLFLDLADGKKREVAAMLNTKGSIPGWEYFADEYDFDYNTKQTIKQAVKSAGQTSPSEHMLKDIFAEMTTQELKTFCTKHNFKSVINEITDIEEELQKP